MEIDDPYAELGIHPDAELIVVEAAYKSLVKEYHPDQGGDAEKFKRIKAAYEAIQEGAGGTAKGGSHTSGEAFSGLGEELFNAFHTPVESETVVGSLSDNLVIEGTYMTVALTGIARLDISKYVFDHLIDEVTTQNRLVLTFHVVNTSNDIHKFSVDDVRVIGADGYQYSINYAVLDHTRNNSLPGRLSPEQPTMEPGTRADIIALVEEVPDGMIVDRVVYPQKIFAQGNTDGWVQEKHRYEFDIQPEDFERMKAFAAGELEAPEDTPETIKALDELEKEPNFDELASIDDLDIDAVSRLTDIVTLQPTTNGELKERWLMESGSEVHKYLERELSDFYYRDDNGKIRATDRASAAFSESDDPMIQ